MNGVVSRLATPHLKLMDRASEVEDLFIFTHVLSVVGVVNVSSAVFSGPGSAGVSSGIVSDPEPVDKACHTHLNALHSHGHGQ